MQVVWCGASYATSSVPENKMLHNAIFGLIVRSSATQAYQHASAVIQALGESDINVNLLVQVDKLVRLLETPTFAYLRLQVILATTLAVILHFCEVFLFEREGSYVSKH